MTAPPTEPEVITQDPPPQGPGIEVPVAPEAPPVEPPAEPPAPPAPGEPSEHDAQKLLEETQALLAERDAEVAEKDTRIGRMSNEIGDLRPFKDHYMGMGEPGAPQAAAPAPAAPEVDTADVAAVYDETQKTSVDAGFQTEDEGWQKALAQVRRENRKVAQLEASVQQLTQTAAEGTYGGHATSAIDALKAGEHGVTPAEVEAHLRQTVNPQAWSDATAEQRQAATASVVQQVLGKKLLEGVVKPPGPEPPPAQEPPKVDVPAQGATPGPGDPRREALMAHYRTWGNFTEEQVERVTDAALKILQEKGQ